MECNYRPDLAKSNPFMAPAPETLCRATICTALVRYRNLAFKERALTDFVLVLNTSMDPDDVPIKICLPVGSKRATVIADLRYPRRPSVELKWQTQNGQARTVFCSTVPLPRLRSLPALHKVPPDLYTLSENLPGRPHQSPAEPGLYDCILSMCKGS